MFKKKLQLYLYSFALGLGVLCGEGIPYTEAYQDLRKKVMQLEIQGDPHNIVKCDLMQNVRDALLMSIPGAGRGNVSRVNKDVVQGLHQFLDSMQEKPPMQDPFSLKGIDKAQFVSGVNVAIKERFDNDLVDDWMQKIAKAKPEAIRDLMIEMGREFSGMGSLKECEGDQYQKCSLTRSDFPNIRAKFENIFSKDLSDHSFINSHLEKVGDGNVVRLKIALLGSGDLMSEFIALNKLIFSIRSKRQDLVGVKLDLALMDLSEDYRVYKKLLDGDTIGNIEGAEEVRFSGKKMLKVYLSKATNPIEYFIKWFASSSYVKKLSVSVYDRGEEYLEACKEAPELKAEVLTAVDLVHPIGLDLPFATVTKKIIDGAMSEGGKYFILEKTFWAVDDWEIDIDRTKWVPIVVTGESRKDHLKVYKIDLGTNLWVDFVLPTNSITF